MRVQRLELLRDFHHLRPHGVGDALARGPVYDAAKLWQLHVLEFHVPSLLAESKDISTMNEIAAAMAMIASAASTKYMAVLTLFSSPRSSAPVSRSPTGGP